MKKYTEFFSLSISLFIFIALLHLPLSTLQADERPDLPYRFLLVISDQWVDPASYLVQGEDEFRVLVTLLKNWGIPFDILRLDQQNFDRYHLLDREGLPRYSTIIWDAAPAGLENKDLHLLSELVDEQAVNLVILGNAVSTPEVAGLAGVRYISEYRLRDGLTFTADHFITRSLDQRQNEFLEEIDFYAYGSKVILTKAKPIVQRGHLPFLTIRQHAQAGRIVWIDVNRQNVQLTIQIMRDLFKRCLVWANGYALYAEYPKSILLFMDDFGTSDRTYLPYWHYRTLNEQDIREKIIKPLKDHRALLNLNIVSGYVDRKTQRIVSPWKQKVKDEIDGQTIHDYISAKKGLDAGQREGVFEIQCHGYTHMLPDLESAPGPFWEADMDGVGTLGFDYEFGDPVREKEIPAITQKFLLARGIEYIQNDFGVRPLFVINGGHAWSHSYPNNSPRLAAGMGFGLSHFNSPGYLGKDIVIARMEPVVPRGSWQYDQSLSAEDIPWTVDAPYFLVFHDRDVSLDARALDRLLAGLGKDTHYMSANEYCGYLHTQVSRIEQTNHALCLAVNYDPHYCRYFESNTSNWTIHLSDEMRSGLEFSVPEKQVLPVPSGLGQHLVCIGAQVK